MAGVWTARFDGNVTERSDRGGVGESQTDDLVFFLRQSVSEVTGELAFSAGRPYGLRLPLRGTVTRSRFNYRAEYRLDNCWLVVEAETRLGPSRTEFSGTQTQSNCEGKVVGRVISIRSPGEDGLPDR